MNEKNRTTAPGPNALPRDGVIINAYEASRGEASANSDVNDLHIQWRSTRALLPLSDDAMMASVEQRLQRWLGDDAADRLFSAPPTLRSPMPAASLETPRLVRSLHQLSRGLAAIFGIPVQAFRRRSASSSY